ncbi:diguanylate cyclase [Candidatus Saccharibacteria bacterium]|nr:diguanylate cyclase [Candidatus Saccharibacteria bacterium]
MYREGVKKVLMVEDSKLLSSLVKNKIESELNFEVVCVYSYQEAFKLLESNQDEYFIGLLDLNLPDANYGEIVDYVISKGIPSIVFTGDISEEVRDVIWSKNVVDYVLKEGSHNIEYIASLVNRVYLNESIEVLVVDDNENSRRHLSNLLRVHRYKIYEADSRTSVRKVMQEHPSVKMVFLGCDMLRADGLAITKDIRAAYAKEELAIIGISTELDKKLSAVFMKNGANDFIHKPFLTEEFYCRVTQNIEMLENIQKIRDTSNKDYLTNLYNRRYFFETGRKLYANARRSHVKISIAMIDVDYFKVTNDTYGHEAGDYTLKQVARTLKERFRESDIVARFGGEEFCVLATNISPEYIYRVFDNLRRNIEFLDIFIDKQKIPITVSIGVCAKPMSTLEEMIKQADSMLYIAKQKGRNLVVVTK